MQDPLSAKQDAMRKLMYLGLFTVLAIPALAARRVTVAQLEETLAADAATHRSDAEVARQVGDLEMTERLTSRTLDRLAAAYKPGPHTAVSLDLLADQSAFLEPPVSEYPATEPPDAAAQQHILAAAQVYAVATWSRMPNFLVTRVTHRFDDAPHVLAKGDWPVNAGLQFTGSSSRQVTFRDGKEVLENADDAPAQEKSAAEELGLHSWGEFGPALTVVLADLAHHKTTFSHWEETPAGIAAVFHYEVPREASHYAVAFRYFSSTVIGRTQFGYSGHNRSPQQVASIPREKELNTYSETPAYHGDIAIDPATGAVLRITAEASLSSDDPLQRAATAIEYGPVTIGDRRFICPTRSLAISREPAWMAGSSSGGNASLNGVGDDSLWQSPLSRPANKTILLINETEFSDYHRFGSTSRILTADAAGGTQSQTPAPAGASQKAVDIPGGQGTSTEPAPESASGMQAAKNDEAVQPDSAQPAAPAAAVSSVVPASPPPLPPEPVVPEISMNEATALPDQPAVGGAPDNGGYSLKVTSRLVNVGLVAYDKKGHPVTDLTANEIELYDNGHKEELRSFAAPAALAVPATPVASGPAPPEAAYSNRASSVSGAPAEATTADAGSTILLIDESHIGWSDMSYARGQILKFLGSLAPTERVGLYTMNGLGFRVLAEVTSDHATLLARMQKFMPSAQSVAEAQDEETRNRQHFDEVHNAADLNTVNGNHIDVPDSTQPIDPQLMTMGDDPTRSAMVILVQVARHLAALPGQKKLVWVSSDNVFADWMDQSVGIEKSPKPMASFLLHAQEAMNEAHTAVYPFDVSQLEGGAITADLQHQNVQLTQAAQDTAGLGGGPVMSRNTGPGRIDAAMSQDLHPVEGPVRDVAAGTGGRVIRRAGDLAGQLDSIVGDERATYALSFSPQGPADDQYHKIEIKLQGRRGVSLRYRSGYFFNKEPETLKDRFRQAIWKPQDVNEIGVSASPATGSGEVTVKVNIATADLGLEQRGDRWMDKLDIFLIQRDDAGLHAQLEGQTLGLRLKPATYQRLMPSGVPFERSIFLKPGMTSVRVLIVDENTGRMGSVTIPASSLHAGT